LHTESTIAPTGLPRPAQRSWWATFSTWLRAATDGVDGAYFSYPITPGLVEATTIFAQAAFEAGVEIIVNMSQKPARPDAGSDASRQHWLSERIFNNFPVPAAHIKPTFFAEWLIQFLDADNTLRLPFEDARHARRLPSPQGDSYTMPAQSLREVERSRCRDTQRTDVPTMA
jgi:hypothetical protein